MAEPRRRRHTVRFALAAIVLVGLLFAFVYPTRTFLDQREDTNRARDQLSLLQAKNAELERTAERLQDPAEIEKLARRDGMVRPNEQAFVIIPAPEPAPVPATDAAGGTGASTP